jgi:hypothetical protein
LYGFLSQSSNCRVTFSPFATLLNVRLMQLKIRFLVRRVGGTIQRFSADPRCPFVEVIGVALLANSQLVRNVRTLNKFLTLEHENISNMEWDRMTDCGQSDKVRCDTMTH